MDREGTARRRKMRANVLLAVGLLMLAGCPVVSPPSREKTAAESREEENARLKKMYEAEVEVNRTLAYKLEVTRIDLEKAHAALELAKVEPAQTVPAFQDFEVDHIRFGWLTGSGDWDGNPGYDGIIAYLLLLDSTGDVLKRKGSCAFELVDMTKGGNAVMTWGVPAEVIGTSWHGVPPGFRVKLPWQGEAPYGDECVLKATFTDAYGRTFTASKLMRIEHKPEEKEAQGGAAGKEPAE